MIQLIRGFRDILPGEVELWQKIEATATALFRDFGFREIRIPIMERTELFARSIGEDTDIVEKEMYTFADRGGELLTLRPEATASVVRSYIQHRMYARDPVRKFYTIGPMFRRERPQKGRYRQFYQINVEVIGDGSAYIDAQLVYMLALLCERLAVPEVTAHINSLGCPACRPAYRRVLRDFAGTVAAKLCPDCRRRMDRNPLRILDCKVPGCREAAADAPALSDHLCAQCREHFNTVKRCLQELGIAFVEDKRLVRGLDYYTRTTFEIQTGKLGAQSAVAGGGRYDGLVAELGGPDTPATGFAIGFDRLAELSGFDPGALVRAPDLYIAALGAGATALAFDWQCRLGRAGVLVESDAAGRSLKSHMKRADRLGAAYTLIVGDAEIAAGEALLRDMASSEQKPIAIEGLVEAVKQRLKG